MRTKILLAAWTAGILFPMAWFSQRIPGYNQWFQRIFAPQWMHILMHAFLYAVLAAGLLLAFKSTRQRPGLVLAGAVLVGVAQEILQPLPAGQLPSSGALFDLGVDLCGAAAGLLAARLSLKILPLTHPSIERHL